MTEPENVRAQVYVSGRVQGVYYRKNARSSALSSGLTGWVRNLPDRRLKLSRRGRGPGSGIFLGDAERGHQWRS